MNAIDDLNGELQRCGSCAPICRYPVNTFDRSRGFGKIQGNGDGRTFFFVGQNPSHRRTPGNVDAFGAGYGLTFRNRLVEAGYDLDECYITNVVKCSTDRFAIPSRQAMATCRGRWLNRELEIVRPRLIIALGSVSQTALGALFLRWGSYMGYETVGTWHPSYVDRFPSREGAYVTQLTEIRRTFEIDAKRSASTPKQVRLL